MAIRADLSGDSDRGAGCGRLRIGGLRAAGSFEFSLMRNQGTEPYLGRGGVWQATEVYHPTAEIERVGDAIVVLVGPDIVDAIVGQPAANAYLLTVATDTGREQGTLKVDRSILGSAAERPAGEQPVSAAEEDAARQRAEEEARRQQEEQARRKQAEEEPSRKEALPQTMPPTPRRYARWIAAVVALLALVAAEVWYTCLIPGFGAPGCRGVPEVPAETVAGEAKGRPASCAGLDAAGCLAIARAALARHDLEAARQLFQTAARLGSVEADNALARMYDPAVWSADSSPNAHPDWETAVYWYETAARAGDLAGTLGAGRLLCGHAATDFERKRGLAYLQDAAAAGSAEAKSLVAGCEAMVAR